MVSFGTIRKECIKIKKPETRVLWLQHFI